MNEIQYNDSGGDGTLDIWIGTQSTGPGAIPIGPGVPIPRYMSEWQREIHAITVSKGFYEPHTHEAQEIGLEIFSKVAYLMGCLEAYRKGLEPPTRLLLDLLDPRDYTDDQLRAAMALMLITTEAVETFEEMVAGDHAHESEEIADIIIRVLDYAEWRGINVDEAVAAKVAKNRDRPFKHGKKL